MKLTPEKRNAIVKVAAGFLVGLAVLWWFGVHTQQAELTRLSEEVAKARTAADKASNWVKNKDAVESTLVAARARLEHEESGLAPIAIGNRKNWLLAVLNSTKAAAGDAAEILEINLLDPADRNAELLPNFPYRASHFRVRMEAYYEDYGRFLARFENDFPAARIQDLVVRPADSRTMGTDPLADPGGSQELQAGEKLTFDFVVVALIKSLSTP